LPAVPLGLPVLLALLPSQSLLPSELILVRFSRQSSRRNLGDVPPSRVSPKS
jgi:hypothetical protein